MTNDEPIELRADELNISHYGMTVTIAPMDYPAEERIIKAFEGPQEEVIQGRLEFANLMRSEGSHEFLLVMLKVADAQGVSQTTAVRRHWIATLTA